MPTLANYLLQYFECIFYKNMFENTFPSMHFTLNDTTHISLSDICVDTVVCSFVNKFLEYPNKKNIIFFELHYH